MRKESELSGRPFEKELRDLDILLENSMRSRHDSIVEPPHGVTGEIGDTDNSANPAEAMVNGFAKPPIMQDSADPGRVSRGARMQHHHLTPEEPNGVDSDAMTNGEHVVNGMVGTPFDQAGSNNREPPTPPLSSSGQLQALSGGGIPWYMEPFDPDGTTIQEERWTGRDLVRGMSEELSDMDEAELSGLVGNDTTGEAIMEPQEAVDEEKAAKAAARKKAAARRKRNRGW